MNQMLDDLLTIGKIESGKFVLEPEPLELVKLCGQLVEDFQFASSQKHQLIFKHQNSNYYPHLDEKLVERVLTNLLSNAIKYSPEGGKVMLEVICQPERAIFRISDEGIGMPPEYKEKIFQRFERGSNVGNIKGTGLGLSIVKQLVELHEGNIIVESEVGIGTTIIVTLTAIAQEN
jgi:signal transduction histidine kinase